MHYVGYEVAGMPPSGWGTWTYSQPNKGFCHFAPVKSENLLRNWSWVRHDMSACEGFKDTRCSLKPFE